MLILGHRGAIHADGELSQNSLLAFHEALADGDGFETDACLSADGEIFLIHEAKYVDAARGVEYCMNEYLDAAGAARLGTRRIDQLNGEEVRRLRLKDGQAIPTLMEAIALAGAKPGKCLNIELKSFGVAAPVLDLIESAIRGGRIAAADILLSSFNHGALPEVRRRMPRIKTGAIFVAADQKTTPLFPWRPESDAAYTALTQEALTHPILAQVRPDFFIMPQEVLNQSTAAMISTIFPEARLAAWVFTEKANLDMADLKARLAALKPGGKVAAMIVDHPGAFRRAL